MFLGGLSLHLNHLIGSYLAISYWQFGTLPIGIFCQIWSQDSLRHLLGPLLVNFDICQFLVTLGPFECFDFLKTPDFGQFFLNEGVTGHQSILGVLGGQLPMLYGGTIFGGGVSPSGHLVGLRVQRFCFSKSLSNPHDPPNFGILTHKLAQMCNYM